MKFVLGYRTELFMIFLVPIQALQWYRFLRYSGTGSSAMMVPIRALRWYRLTDTIKECKYFVLPKTNVEFWSAKIERNRKRYAEEQHQLASMSWHCITIWECQLKSKVRQQTLESLVYTLSHIFLEDRRCKIYNSTDESLRIVAESKRGLQWSEK